jgi:hypothetical protein
MVVILPHKTRRRGARRANDLGRALVANAARAAVRRCHGQDHGQDQTAGLWFAAQ